MVLIEEKISRTRDLLIYIYEWNNKHMAMLCNIPLNTYDKVVTLKMLRLLIHSLVKDDIH